MAEARVSSDVTLDFRPLGEAFRSGKKPRIANVSALAADGDLLWSASDEGATIERLRLVGDAAAADRFVATDSVALNAVFPAFEPLSSDAEADLEALCFEAGSRRLWMCGSHCWSLGKHGDEATFLTDPDMRRRRRARTLLGFAEVDDGGELSIGRCLPAGEDQGGLLAAIGWLDDACLTDSLRKLSKQGGLDIEGMAAFGDNLLIGLRGPVCEGNAIVLRAHVDIGATGLAISEPPGVARLGLGGLGVRDLLIRGRDILVLAGPMGDPDEPGSRTFAVHRWAGGIDAMSAGHDQVVQLDETTRILDLTSAVAAGAEKPEGMTIVGGGRLVIVRDGRGGPEGLLGVYAYDLPG